MKAMDLDHDMLLDAARLMESQGGSFAGHIARAFYCADSTNRERLLTAFDDLFCKYYRQHRLENFKQFLDEYEEGEMK
jgi:hypothetical protein